MTDEQQTAQEWINAADHEISKLIGENRDLAYSIEEALEQIRVNNSAIFMLSKGRARLTGGKNDSSE